MDKNQSIQESSSTNKPVNISISFNINPKNILNNVIPVDNQLKGKKINHDEPVITKKNMPYPPRTPQLIQTDRYSYNKKEDQMKANQENKKKKTKKRNSVDEGLYNRDHSFKQSEGDKSVKTGKKIQSVNLHSRKKSTKNKQSPAEFIKSKRNHSKFTEDLARAGYKTVGLENHALKSAMMDYNVTERKSTPHGTIKSMMNKITKNQLSKTSLPLNSVNKTKNILQSRKKPRKSSQKNNKSDSLLARDKFQDPFEGPKCKRIIENLTSLKSMNNSVFETEMVDEEKPMDQKERSFIIHTQQSMDLIDEIHQYELHKKDKKEQKDETNSKTKQTHSLISTYIAMMQEQVNYQGVEEPLEEQISIQGEFERYRSKFKKYDPNYQHEDSVEDKASDIRDESEITEQKHQQVDLNFPFKEKQRQEQVEQNIRPFCSSQMTKQQSLINELERIKLNQLKKHEVQKWGELLGYIRDSLSKGTMDTDDILINVYSFLEKTKEDLQISVKQSGKVSKVKEQPLQQFTNKLSSKEVDSSQMKQQQNMIAEEASSMSFRDDITEQDEQLKLMNLQTIQNALKQRYQSLLDRQNREITSLEEQREYGKINEIDFILQKERIEKWIKNQTNQILKAKKNLWKGYNQAKGILEKTAKSNYFHEAESSTKKKSMMKCLSENYLLKTNYKKLLLEKEQFKSEQSSHEKGSENSSIRIKKEQTQLLNDDQDIEKIKERLLDIKNRHLKQEFQEQKVEESPNISYEEVEKELEQSYSSQEMNIIRNEASPPREIPILQPQNNKLKYICAEDKEDIFQFIFLDLCIELYQEPCHDNVLMNSISGHISKMKKQATKKKGVKTSLNIVKEYLKRFTGFVLRTKKEVLRTIDDALGPTALEMLRYMHENDEQFREEEDLQTTLVIPTNVFDQFEKNFLPSIQFQPYYEDDDDKETRRLEFLKNILHIHNKALFDALNEFLDQLRPYGIWGKPFPWKKTPTFLHETSAEQKQQKLQKAVDKVIQYCSYVCGLLVDKQESLVGSARLSDDYIEQIKEDRLSRMLANELVENEERWLFYDDEQTEVLVEISSFVYAGVLKDTVEDIGKVLRKS